ncbi:MAG TPA: hypothetical protein VH092_14015, partial [Urbifossiella sp.]|nr:hypothetical protein [Urbifossiella sp.]
GPRYELLHFTRGGVPVTQFRPATFDPARQPDQPEGVAFFDVLDRACARHRMWCSPTAGCRSPRT